jgi:hypothetical protein
MMPATRPGDRVPVAHHWSRKMAVSLFIEQKLIDIKLA